MNQRKHVTQMSGEEIEALESFAHNLPRYDWNSNPHVRQRMREKRISDSEILATLRKGKAIEAHANNFPDIRFVLRHTIGNRAICVCASMRGGVSTVWANNAGDNHKTLDSSQYQWKANLTSVFHTQKRG